MRRDIRRERRLSASKSSGQKASEITEDSSSVHSAQEDYSKDELKHEVMRRRIKSFNFGR